MKPRARWLYVLLPIAGAVELGMSIAERSPEPAPEDYGALEGALESVYHDGDLVVVAPRWAEPHVRHAAGDRYFPLSALGRSDVERFSRAIEVSADGERSQELSAFREVERRDVGPFVVRVLDNPAPERVVFDFVEGLGPRFASAEGTDPKTRCTWNERAEIMTGGLGGHPGFPRARFDCPESPYLNVSVTVIADETFLPRRCIWAHPTQRGARVIRFSGVPLGERIVGHSGMYWMIEREKKGAPVDLTVRVDGREIGRTQHLDGQGWERFEMPLGEDAHKPSATVELVVSSPNYRDRHFCFQADTR